MIYRVMRPRKSAFPSSDCTYGESQFRTRTFPFHDGWIETTVLWMLLIPEDIRLENVATVSILLEHGQIEDLARI